MDKILKILHKKLDQNIEKLDEVKNKKKQMETLIQFDKLEYIDKNDFDYFENEILYHGIYNKQALEKAYKEGKIKMFDYYDVLAYPEKKRLMNYEISVALQDLIHFTFEDQKIFIPFFEKKMNAIYENEMVLFDLKQYYRLMLEYKELIQRYPYGYQVFDSDFSSLSFIFNHEENASLYSELKGRLYFLEKFKMKDFITLPNLEREKLLNITNAYFTQSKEEFITLLWEYSCINEKIHKKLLKALK